MAKSKNTNELAPKQKEELLKTLKMRFEKNKNRHKGIDWDKVLVRLEKYPGKLWSLNEWSAPEANPM